MGRGVGRNFWGGSLLIRAVAADAVAADDGTARVALRPFADTDGRDAIFEPERIGALRFDEDFGVDFFDAAFDAAFEATFVGAMDFFATTFFATGFDARFAVDDFVLDGFEVGFFTDFAFIGFAFVGVRLTGLAARLLAARLFDCFFAIVVWLNEDRLWCGVMPYSKPIFKMDESKTTHCRKES